MRKKLMRWLAAGMALCLTLGAAPAASAAQLPQDAPGFEKIMPYALYILDSSCTLTISGKTATAKAWVSGYSGECSATRFLRNSDRIIEKK